MEDRDERAQQQQRQQHAGLKRLLPDTEDKEQDENEEEDSLFWEETPTPVIAQSPSGRYMHTTTTVGDSLFVMGGAASKDDFTVWRFSTKTFLWEKFVKGEEGANGAPSHRWGHTATRVNKYIVVFGGWDSTSQFNDTYLLNLETGEWSDIMQKSKELPHHRSLHSCVATRRNTLVMFGGSRCVGGPYLFYDDVWEFSLETRKWRELQTTGTKPRARAQHSAVLVDGRYMYVLGGCDEVKWSNDLHCLDLETNTWTKVATTGTAPPSRTYQGTNFKVSNARRPAVLFRGNKIITYGGPRDSVHPYSGDIYLLDLETREWKLFDASMQANSPSLRGFHTLNIIDSRIFLFGGVGAARTMDTHVHSLEISCMVGPKPVPTSTFVNDLSNLLNLEKFSDFQFVIEPKMETDVDMTDDKNVNNNNNINTNNNNNNNNNSGTRTIHAHTNILYVRCPYFRAMLDSSMKETKAGQLVVTDAEYDVFFEMLRFIYTDSANVTPANATALIVLANQYGLERLEAMCESVIVRSFDNNTVISVLLASDSLRLLGLRTHCIQHILKRRANFVAVTTSPQWAQEVPPELQKEVQEAYYNANVDNAWQEIQFSD